MSYDYLNKYLNIGIFSSPSAPKFNKFELGLIKKRSNRENPKEPISSEYCRQPVQLEMFNDEEGIGVRNANLVRWEFNSEEKLAINRVGLWGDGNLLYSGHLTAELEFSPGEVSCGFEAGSFIVVEDV